ncbi:putative WRKY transcription factor 70, partial [Mucuna pruriens]
MDHKKIFHELVRGREFAHKLRKVINGHDHEGDDGSAATTSLVQSLCKNVLSSFTNTLFLLDRYPTYESLGDNSHIQQRDSSFTSPTQSQDSQQSFKSFTRNNNRRGCYKRKRTTQEWEKVSENPIVDGHKWRKYGQKTILKAKYSRSYYRCTHRYDQNCQATKQVQRIQEKPPLYKTTYCGHHTCNDLLINSEIVLDSNNSPLDTSILLSFNNTFPTPTKQECPFLSSFPSPSVNKEEATPSSSSNHYLLSQEPTLDDSSRHNNVTLSTDHWDVMSAAVLCDSVLDDVSLLLDFDD